MKKLDPLPALLRAFFYEWLVEQRNASGHTVRSYRDTWRLFLRFVAQRHHRTVAQLRLEDLTGAEVGAFLQYIEKERGDSIGTRNCRLDPPEVEAILAQPDRSTLGGQRDHALLSFLYNTGARIQEALELRPNAIRWESPACVRLYGKGRKERLCPLWPETMSLLEALLKRQPRADDERLFVNRYGAPLGASGVRFKLAHYVAAAAKKVPSLGSKNVTPHSFRHATAVHLVAAGVDITVIRSWLGHVSLDTTNHYAQANLETKRKALERVGVRSKAGTLPQWRRDRSILAWLDSL